MVRTYHDSVCHLWGVKVVSIMTKTYKSASIDRTKITVKWKKRRKQNIIKMQSLMEIKMHHHTKFEASPHTYIPDNARKPHGPLTRYVNFPVAHAPGMAGTSYPPLRISDPDMHHGTCVTYVPWCLPGSLTSGFLWSWWRGKRSRHSRHMHNPQFYVSDNRTINRRTGEQQRDGQTTGMMIR